MHSLLIGNFGRILKRSTRKFLFFQKHFSLTVYSRVPLENIIQRTINKKADEKQTLNELKEEFSRIESFDRFNRSLFINNHMCNLLSFFSLKLNEIKDIEGVEGADTQKNYSELLKILNIFQNHEDKFVFIQQNKKFIKELFKNIAETYAKLNEKDEKKKGILLETLFFFIQRLYTSLETENYIKFFKKTMNEINFGPENYFHKICEVSTHEIFIEYEFLPEEYLKFIENLKDEKNSLVSKNLYPLHKNALIKMISFMEMYSFEKSRMEKIIEKTDFNSENISIEKLEGIQNLSELNYVLTKIFEKIKNNSGHVKSEGVFNQISKLLGVKLESLLSNSNLQNFVYFGIIMAEKSFLFNSKILIIYNCFISMKINDIFSLIYFLVPLEEDKNKIFINEKSLRLLVDYSSAIFEKKIDSLDLLMYMKLYNLHYKSLFGDQAEIYKLLTTVNKVLMNNYKLITEKHKFYLLNYVHNLDIRAKTQLLLPDIAKNMKLCPRNILPSIIKILCDSYYFFKDISEYESLILENLNDLDSREIMEILRGYIYHLKGSKTFLTALLEKFFDLTKDKKTDFMINYNMYQLIYTLLNLYPFEINLKESKLQSYLAQYELYFFKFDPKKNKMIHHGKEFFEFDKLFKFLNLSFKKDVLVGINNVNYVIENKYILDILGKNDFCDSGQKLRGYVLWKERNLKAKKNYEYVTINIWEWRQIDTFKEKQDKLKKILNLEKLIRTF